MVDVRTGISSMTMTFADTKIFIASLNTDNADEFERQLGLKAIAALDSANGIEFLDIDRSKRAELVGAVQAGAQKAACEQRLKDRFLAVKVSAEVVQPFVTAVHDRSGWFQYFLTEAVAGLGKADPEVKARIEGFMQALFVKRGTGWVMPVAFDQIPDATLKMTMLELLTLGFERIPATQNQAVAGDASDAAIIGKMLWAGPSDQVSGTNIKVIDVAFRWRGDSRPWDDISRANGFATKANSADYAAANNLTAAWNPFSDQNIRSYLWFRKQATDNCLYNTISVGKNTQWLTYLPYPLIKLSGGKITGVRGYQGKKKVRVREVGMYGSGSFRHTEIELPVSVTYIYLFVLAGLALDTGAMQGKDAYPEIGVGAIPFKNVYGSIKCTRIHLGDEATVTDDDGVLVKLERARVTDDNGLTIQASYGSTLFAQMKDAYDAVLRRGVVGVVWRASGDGYAEFDRPFDKTFQIGGKTYDLVDFPAV